MDRSLVGQLARAFELAFFIHRDKAIALSVTTDALARVEVLARTQAKRRYYRPAGRSRVAMTKAQLVQKLLYISSEPYERRQEASSSKLSQDDMSVRYMACLSRICLRRNAFHVAVGFGRLLYAYPTGDALALYDQVAQDPERLRDSDYVRARKKQLVSELLQRFGALLKPRRGQRGEQRFEVRRTDPKLRQLVGRCLELMTPWETRCTVPEGFRPTVQELAALRFDGTRADDEHPVEMNRIHALLHPTCLARLAQALGLAPPMECLEVPQLGGTHTGGDDRNHPPRLEDADHRAIRGECERREDLRRRATAGIFRVHLDGVEAAKWDAARHQNLHLKIEDPTELVEVISREGGEDVLLAAHLLPALEEAAPPQPLKASVRLDGGRRFDFIVSRTPSGWRCTVVFRDTLLRHLAGLLPSARTHRIRRPLGAFALLTLTILTAVLLRNIEPASVPPRLRGPSASVITVHEVRNVFVRPFGTDPRVEALQTRLSEHLAASGILNVVSEHNAADAVLVLVGPPPVLRLVDIRGRELWRLSIPRGAQDPDGLAAWITAELVTAVDPLQPRQSP